MGSLEQVDDKPQDCNGSDWSHILQESKNNFMATSIKTKKLVGTLTKCIFMLVQGDMPAPDEATDLFFYITRLFQYKGKNIILRKLIYIGIKALSKQAENVYVVTSSLTTDVDSSKDDPATRASALRALCHILDPVTMTDRYLRQCIVDKSPVVASAAISSLMRFASSNSAIIGQCSAELQQALRSEHPMVQYHALGILYNFSLGDTSALSNLIMDCMKLELTSPLACCLLIKIITSFINENQGEETSSFRNVIKLYLDSKSEMVEYEAANAIVNLKSADTKLKSSAIAHMRNFLTSPKQALRFGALRILNSISSPSKSWTLHRIGKLCNLHLLNKQYGLGDTIVGVIDFSNGRERCVKYSIIWQCEELQSYAVKNEFVLGLKKQDFKITIPKLETNAMVLHCLLSFVYYIITDDNIKTSFEDPAGLVDLGATQLETQSLTCDFPILVYP